MPSTKDAFHLAELFDFLEGVLAWVKDRQGPYVWVNRAFLVNYALDHPGAAGLASAEKILGKTDYELCQSRACRIATTGRILPR